VGGENKFKDTGFGPGHNSLNSGDFLLLNPLVKLTAIYFVNFYFFYAKSFAGVVYQLEDKCGGL
jgi:hypothetical protein